jgi:putative intracellular protease/amidase
MNKSKRILMLVANPATSTTVGGPVGFWASELTHAYYEFRHAGYDVTVASPDGGPVEFDAMSDPRDESGYSKADGRPEPRVRSFGRVHVAY